MYNVELPNSFVIVSNKIITINILLTVNVIILCYSRTSQ